MLISSADLWVWESGLWKYKSFVFGVRGYLNCHLSFVFSFAKFLNIGPKHCFLAASVVLTVSTFVIVSIYHSLLSTWIPAEMSYRFVKALCKLIIIMSSFSCFPVLSFHLLWACVWPTAPSFPRIISIRSKEAWKPSCPQMSRPG